MLQLFRNNSPYTVIILFIITLLLKLQALLHPAAPVILPHEPFFDWLVHLLNTVMCGNPFAYTFLAAVLLFGQSIYLTGIAVRHRLFAKPTYLPAFTYIIFTSVLPAFSYFTAPLIVTWLVLGALDTMLKFSQPQRPRTHIFNAGLLLAIAALLQFSALGYLLLLLLALLLLRSFNAGEWVVAMMGYCTPFYFLAGLLYLFNKLPLLRRWPDLGISLPRQMGHPLYLMGAVTGFIILTVCGFYTLQGGMARYAIAVRRGWGAVVCYAVASLPVVIFTSHKEGAAWLCILPPLALIAAHPMGDEKSRLFPNFIFYFLAAFALFCQLTVFK